MTAPVVVISASILRALAALRRARGLTQQPTTTLRPARSPVSLPQTAIRTSRPALRAQHSTPLIQHRPVSKETLFSTLNGPDPKSERWEGADLGASTLRR